MSSCVAANFWCQLYTLSTNNFILATAIDITSSFVLLQKTWHNFKVWQLEKFH